MIALPTADDIETAAVRIAPFILRTPLIESPDLNARMGTRIFLKAENLQRTGSFKIRGATNRLLMIPQADRPKGVVAFSSGNHAQGVAEAAQLLCIPATIVMPSDAPAPKIAGTRNRGAKLIFYDRLRDDREAIARDISAATGAAMVPPFDDARIIAGQGTVGLEFAAQAKDRGAKLGEVFVPCSGGGLTSGTALALSHLSPTSRVIAVEPAGFDGMGHSLATKARTTTPGGRLSIADALMAPTPGRIPFALAQATSCAGIAIGDEDLRRAVSFAAQVLKIVIEPSGAAGLAAVLCSAATSNEAVGVVVSGGNCDVGTISACCVDYPNP